MKLSPILHANTKQISINFSQTYTGTDQNLNFTCSEEINLVPGQEIEVQLVDLELWLVGTYNKTSDGIHTLYLDKELFQYSNTLEITSLTAAIIWVSFDIEGKWNELLTRADIIRTLKSTQNNMLGTKVTKYGTPGLIDGFDKLKLNQHKLNISVGPFDLLENNYQEVGFIVVMRNIQQLITDDAMMREFLCKHESSIEFSLKGTNIGEEISLAYGNMLKVIKCSGASFTVKFVVETYTNLTIQDSFMAMRIFIKCSKALNQVYAFHKINSIDDYMLAIPNGYQLGTMLSSDLGTLTEFTIDPYTLAYTSTGQLIRVDVNSEKNVQSYVGSEDAVKTPGHYYNSTTKSYLFVTTYGTKVLQRLTEITDGLATTKERTFDTGTGIWYDWKVLSYVGHKHTADDVTETADKFWLTAANKLLMQSLSDKYSSSIYQEPVNTFNDLATVYPTPSRNYIVTCKDTNITWQYNVTTAKWDLHSANGLPFASSKSNGLMTIESYNKLQRSSLSKKILTNGLAAFIHGENDEALYASKIDEGTIDLVKRTTLAKKLGTKAVNLGNSIESFGNYTIAIGNSISGNVEKNVLLGYAINAGTFEGIGIGQGLLFDKKSTIIGTFNAPLVPKNLIFAIANGTSDAARSNAFGVTEEGYAIANKFMVNGATGENVLLDNGSTLPVLSFATAEALTSTNNRKVDKNKHITLTLVDEAAASVDIIVPYITADDLFLNVE